MSRIKNLSRGNWMVVGIVTALILVPSGMAVAGGFSGIKGTSGNKADVSAAGQLLTTEALPTTYKDYEAPIASADLVHSGLDCETAATIPVGQAFVVQQVEVDVFGANSPGTSNSGPAGNFSNAGFRLYADGPSDACGGSSNIITTGEAPGANVGNVAIPLIPGYVIPSGYKVDADGNGIDAYVYFIGYLVPSSDAPATP